MTKKRVLLIHNFYQIGGGEHTVFENEKRLLQDNGHEVFLYTRDNMELREAKWKMAVLPFTTVWSARTFIQVRRTIQENEIDIIHCHNTFPLISPSVYYAARSLKIPIVQTIHNYRFVCPNGQFFCNQNICEKCRQQNTFLPALRNRCYRGSVIQTAVVVVMLKFHRWLGTYRKINYIFLTEFGKSKFDKLIDIDADNVFVKPNFVYRSAVLESNTQIKSKFVYAGRLDENKGIGFLLDAWPDLPVEYELHIYGDGKLRAACEKAAGTYPNIHYFGFHPGSVISLDLADAAALIFPSVWYESFGMSWAESFALGRPVVATALGNHGDLVRKSQAGVVYESGNKTDFHDALKQVVEKNETFSKNARRFFEEYLSERRNYEMLSEIYENAKHIC